LGVPYLRAIADISSDCTGVRLSMPG
jgi:hypothetical protein